MARPSRFWVTLAAQPPSRQRSRSLRRYRMQLQRTCRTDARHYEQEIWAASLANRLNLACRAYDAVHATRLREQSQPHNLRLSWSRLAHC